MSRKSRNKIVVFPSYYLNFFAKIPFVLQDNWYKTPDKQYGKTFPENIDFSLVGSTKDLRTNLLRSVT